MSEPFFDPKRGDWSNIKPKNPTPPPSNLHVYAVGCSWHGPIEKVGKTKGSMSIPCCPHCGSVLMQTDETKWWKGAKEHEDAGHTNYEKFLRWSEQQPKCWKTLADAAQAYANEFQVEVKLDSRTLKPNNN